MKKGIYLLLLALPFCNCLSAQTFSLTALGGYTFQDHVSFSSAYSYIRASGHWGASVEGIIPNGGAIQLLFQTQPTHAPFYFYNTPNNEQNKGKDKCTLTYIMLNGLRYVQTGSAAEPYGGLGLGVGIVAPEAGTSATKFAWDAFLGVKIKTGSAVGIKLQAQLYSMAQVAGGGFYAGTGGGGAYVSTYSTIVQFGLTGGICFDFAKGH